VLAEAAQASRVNRGGHRQAATIHEGNNLPFGSGCTDGRRITSATLRCCDGQRVKRRTQHPSLVNRSLSGIDSRQRTSKRGGHINDACGFRQPAVLAKAFSTMRTFSASVQRLTGRPVSVTERNALLLGLYSWSVSGRSKLKSSSSKRTPRVGLRFRPDLRDARITFAMLWTADMSPLCESVVQVARGQRAQSLTNYVSTGQSHSIVMRLALRVPALPPQPADGWNGCTPFTPRVPPTRGDGGERPSERPF